MSEEKEPKPISRKTRAYVSLIFLILILPTFIIWIMIINPVLPLDQSLNALILLTIVWVGLAGIPWLPVLFPRE
ncbi:MAG: hypothetical protein ACXADB_12615 [Candidatus Hermodarchaeia archaeon]|jgi:hypothetical protein